MTNRTYCNRCKGFYETTDVGNARMCSNCNGPVSLTKQPRISKAENRRAEATKILKGSAERVDVPGSNASRSARDFGLRNNAPGSGQQDNKETPEDIRPTPPRARKRKPKQAS